MRSRLLVGEIGRAPRPAPLLGMQIGGVGSINRGVEGVSSTVPYGTPLPIRDDFRVIVCLTLQAVYGLALSSLGMALRLTPIFLVLDTPNVMEAREG